MDMVMSKIAAIAKVNEEIIARVEKRKPAQIQAYDYTVTQVEASKLIEIKEFASQRKAADVVMAYKFRPGQFVTDVWNIFNDKIDYTESESWEDLTNLNKAIYSSAQKFALLKDNEKILEELRKLLTNIEIVQVGLGEVESSVLDSKSRLKELEAEAQDINDRIKKLLLKVPLIRTFPQCSILTGEQELALEKLYSGRWKILYQCSRDGRTAKSYHDRCDNKGETISLVQTSQGYLFGGYASVSWLSTNQYSLDNNASLFSLVSPAGNVPSKYPVIVGNPNALFFGGTYGPAFGGGHDIYFDLENEGGSYTGFPVSYTDTTGRGNTTFTGERHFTFTDLVVFGKAD